MTYEQTVASLLYAKFVELMGRSLLGCMLPGKKRLFLLIVLTKVMLQEFSTLANSIVVKKLSVITFLPEPLYKLTRSNTVRYQYLLVEGRHSVSKCTNFLPMDSLFFLHHMLKKLLSHI